MAETVRDKITNHCYQCGGAADYGTAGDSWCWSCDAAAHYAYGRQSSNDNADNRDKVWDPKWLVERLTAAESLIPAMGVVLTNLTEERDQLRAILEQVNDAVKAVTIHPEAIQTTQNKIKRGSWVYFPRKLYNDLVKVLSEGQP